MYLTAHGDAFDRRGSRVQREGEAAGGLVAGHVGVGDDDGVLSVRQGGGVVAAAGDAIHCVGTDSDINSRSAEVQ